ncbi:MAG: RimK family alpha-L-glutamate ligase [Candidatus Magasanikbacteria bacterium]|nr:RimK family alpha-L-glutamate ligase [Candidatus Magasanikbacteria bacterium]
MKKKVYLLTTCKPENSSVSTRILGESAKKLNIELKTIYTEHCHLKIEDGKLTLFENDKILKGIKKILFRKTVSSTSSVFHKSILHQFELNGTKVINRIQGISQTRDQFHTLQILAKYSIPTPKSFLLGSIKQIDSIIKEIGKPPYIVKILDSKKGRGVFILESKRSLISFASIIVGSREFPPLLIQEFIAEAKGKDIRVFIIGNKVVASMERKAMKKGEFRSNYKLGGSVKKIKITKEEEKLALKAAKVCGLQIVGVDIIRSKKGPLIIELNSNPGLEGITKATEKDIAGEILKYAINR